MFWDISNIVTKNDNNEANNEDVIEGRKKSEFKSLLSLATQESYFIFNDVLYKEKDGVTMANISFSSYEIKWLEQCLKGI